MADRGQQLQHDFKILKARNDLIDARDGDECPRQREAHPSVAFGFHDANAAGFRDKKVRAADGNGSGKKLPSQVQARGLRQILGLVAEVGKIHGAGKKFAHLVTILMQRRNNDV